MAIRLLFIDDDKDMCELVEAGAQQNGIDLRFCYTALEALELVRTNNFDVVVTDLNLEKSNGLELCEQLVANRPDVPVIMITAFGSMDHAIGAIRAGAYDFINKPVDLGTLIYAVKRAAQHKMLHEEVKMLREQVGHRDASHQLIGECRSMKRLYEMIARLRDSEANVLIYGESGTGKELVARALHTQSPRKDQPFVAINCAAVPPNLLESELFGHVRGAFTDAHANRKGLFEISDNGTIFLDEIGEMPLEMQAKLLRVLEERKIRPVGGDKEIAFDTRIVAATNRDLEEQVEKKKFREDLYYRLNVVQINLPSLRNRENDILLLAQHFLVTISKRLNKPIKGFTSEVAKKLLEYDWPGNVRQLQNTIERAVTLARFEEIGLDDLPEKIGKFESSKITLVDHDAENLLSLEELEKRYIDRVLKAVSGNKTQAAQILGLDRRTLYRKLVRYQKSQEPKTLNSASSYS